MKRTKVLMIVMTVWTEIGRDRSLIIKTMNRLSPLSASDFRALPRAFCAVFRTFAKQNLSSIQFTTKIIAFLYVQDFTFIMFYITH